MSWASVLQPLREVPGVQGFLLLDDAGQVVARDLNSLYDDGMLQAVARRVMTLVEASKEILAGSEAWLLRFEAYAISIRRTASHVLLALTSHEANFAALGVAGRLLLRRLGERRLRDGDGLDRGALGDAPPADHGQRHPAAHRQAALVGLG